MDKKRSTRKAVDGMQVIRLPNGGFQETFITVPAIGSEEPASLFQRLYDFLADNAQLRIVREDVFGLDIDPFKIRHARGYRVAGIEWPMTWVEEGNGGGGPIAGVQVHAVSGIDVHPINLEGHTVGTLFEDQHARYCVMGGLHPESIEETREEQAWETFEIMESALELAGMTFSNVFRTWFYLDDILDWYDEFNGVRNQFFLERKVCDGLVPASTGIGGGNSAGTAVIAGLLAIQPKGPTVRLQAIPSPLQCPAVEYGSSFSRAVELELPGQRRLYVSGTASIAPGGETCHVGDLRKQVALTMDVVAAILESRRMGWGDVTRMIGYCKHGEDASEFDRYCRDHKLPKIPVIIAKNDICRDDLLFEIEADAAKLGGPPLAGAN